MKGRNGGSGQPLPPVASRCHGRRIFVYDHLPGRFHQDLIDNCSSSCGAHCDSLCPALERDGLGAPLPTPTSADGSPQPITDQYRGAAYSFGPWQGSQQNMVGVVFRARMRGYECLTTDWTRADAFYIPALLGLRTLYGAHLAWREIEELGDELEVFLSYQPGFLKNSGKDHFLVVGQQIWDFMGKERTNPGKGWPWTTYSVYRPALGNLTWVSVERVAWEARVQSIPYLTSFHPQSREQVEEWVEHARWHPRSHMAVVVATKGDGSDMRSAVWKACEARPELCRLVECGNECPRGACRAVRGHCGDPRQLTKLYLSATFCLALSGDTATRRSTFDAMLAGCIPVVFDRASFDWQYNWHKRGLQHQEISVTFDRIPTINGTIDFLKELSEIPEDKTSKMRDNVLSLVPSLTCRDHLVGNGSTFYDAFDVAVDGILRHLANPITTPGF